jgi:hypothetical protein
MRIETSIGFIEIGWKDTPDIPVEAVLIKFPAL